MNAALRTRDRSLIKGYFPYFKILLRGLHRLPPWDEGVHRGVKLDLSVRPLPRRVRGVGRGLRRAGAAGRVHKGEALHLVGA